MNSLNQSYAKLLKLLNDADAGNDEIRDAAISVCDELGSNPHLLHESHHAANLVEITRQLTALNSERWGYTIESVDEIIRLAKAFTAAEAELVGDSWNDGYWPEAVAAAVNEIDARAGVHIPDEELVKICRKAISGWATFTVCKMCGKQAPVASAHLHQGQLIGECCWDERLRSTE